jgi:hypothetical protein
VIKEKALKEFWNNKEAVSVSCHSDFFNAGFDAGFEHNEFLKIKMRDEAHGFIKEINKLQESIADYKMHMEDANKEVEQLKEELNNSKNFHCPHYLTNDSGRVSCHKNFTDYQLLDKYEELGKAYVAILDKVQRIMNQSFSEG